MPSPEAAALARIRQAAARGAAQLELSRLGLTSLPPDNCCAYLSNRCAKSR